VVFGTRVLHDARFVVYQVRTADWQDDGAVIRGSGPAKWFAYVSRREGGEAVPADPGPDAGITRRLSFAIHKNESRPDRRRIMAKIPEPFAAAFRQHCGVPPASAGGPISR
jgi:hypothetical protein